MRRALTFGASLATGALSLILAQTPSPAGRLAGCYAVQLLSDLPFPSPPSRIRLIQRLGTSSFEAGHHLVRTLPDSTVRPYRFSYWGWLNRDSIFVRWTTGFQSTELQLALTRDSLVGVAEQRSDDIDPSTPSPRARVLLRRIQCP